MKNDDTMSGLGKILAGYGSLAICFSGGVDSAFLLRAATDCLGREKVVALTAVAENFPDWEEREALDYAASLGCRHEILPFDPFSLPEFVENAPERCYHCKLALFTALRRLAQEMGYANLADGTNVDDLGDYRPGLRAVRELGVVSPLLEAGMGKDDIRRLARGMDLPFWNKPSFACLASRFPHGETITREKLEQVARAEEYFLALGFSNVRVRRHGALARVEVDADERRRLFDEKALDAAAAELKRLGFEYVAMDMAGYRTGSMNPCS